MVRNWATEAGIGMARARQITMSGCRGEKDICRYHPLRFTDRLIPSSYSMGRASRSMARAFAANSARRDCSFFEIVPIRAASYLAAAMCVIAPHMRLLS